MNYNNFASRVSVLRLTPVPRDKGTNQPVPKKVRKTVPRRVAPSVVVAVLLALAALGGAGQAQVPKGPQIVPAPGTVIFAEGPDWTEQVAPIHEESVPVFDHPLLAELEVVAAQVQASAPAPPPHPSLLTMILLGGGSGVGLFQARLLFRRDLTC